MNKISNLFLSTLLMIGVGSVYADTTKKKEHKQENRVERDNTAVNQRDRAVHEVTADQQGMNRADTEVTRLIRKEIVADDSLSTYAHNIKIITENGRVTLKGPVRSLEEKNKVIAVATNVAGRLPIDDNLDIVNK